MNFWSNYPFSRLFLPFVLGIVLEIYFPSFQFFHGYFSAVLLIVYAVLVYLNKSIKNAWFNGVVLTLLLFSLGHNYVGVYSSSNYENHYSNFIKDDEKTSLLLKITEPTLDKPKSIQVKGEVMSLFSEDAAISTRGKLLMYLQKDSLSQAVSVGDTLLIFSSLNEIEDAKNPGQFNYKRFLRFHEIFHQGYCSQEFWSLVGENKSFSLLAFADDFRKKMLAILQKSKLEEDEFAVASALILGYKESLDDDLVLAYSSSGAMHVLAVSGLHVGIVYMVLNFFLGFLDKSKHTKYLKALLLLLCVWFYAFVTGLSPSVMRAATMFSFVIVGQTFKRNTNIFNTLFASVFFLLVFNPYLIMQVGFQLSYLAVAGIVYIQPKLYKQLYAKNWLLDKIWAITAVSIAAQIATFPLGLLYFHQFPNYFFVSNLVVIPAATIILAVGIAALVFSQFSWLFIPLSYVLNYSIKILNESVFFIDRLPYSLTQGISISVLECWLIYLCIALIIGFLVYKKNYLLFGFLCSLVAILSIDLYEDAYLSKQKKIIIYNIKGSTTIDFINGFEHVFLSDSATYYNNSTMLFNVKHNWDDLDLEKEIFVDVSDTIVNTNYFSKQKHVIRFMDKTLFVVDTTFHLRKLHGPIEVDYLLLTQNAKVKVQDLLQNFRFENIIIDGSCKASYAKNMTKYAKEANLPCYYTGEAGAFVK